VCTLNRYDDVEVCLDALGIAAADTEIPHEIIVIDQTDPPARRGDLVARYPSIKHIYQNDKGLSIARNLGVQESSGEVLAYLDDDAVPSPQWFTEIALPFQSDGEGKVLACGGKVIADYRKRARPDWMTPSLEAYLSCINWGDRGRFLNQGEWIVGANMAFRRSVFHKIDLFDVSLGRKGTKILLSNEEIGMIEKIGLEHIWYVPNAVVNHVIAPERLDQTWFRRRVYWQAVSDLIADCVWLTPEQAWEDISRFLTASPAELRSLLGLFHDCADAESFDAQLKAIYGLIILGSAGFKQIL
jgi:glycosyltransferase involved in cell wall biosynthesis